MADNLKALRGKFSVLQFSHVVGVSKTQLYKIERRKAAATVDLLAEVGKKVGREPWQLLLPEEVAEAMERAGVQPDGNVRKPDKRRPSRAFLPGNDNHR